VSSFEQAKQVVDQLDQRIRSIPGVQAAALTDDLPLTGGSTQPIQIEGYPVVAMADQPEVSVRVITSQYFKTMQIPLRSGRMLADADNSKAPKVVVVSQSLADRFWPNQNPIGKRLALTFAKDGMREVVGVVGDVKDNGLDAKDAVPMLYYPIAQLVVPAEAGPFRGFGLEVVARANGNPADSAPTIIGAIHSVSPNTPVTEVKTMQDVIEETISPQRFNMLLLATFAGIALFLSAIGIYSVLAYSVRQRVREIGIRIALGAQLRDVLRMVLSEGMRPTILGVVIGLAASILLSRLVSSLIYGIKVLDIPTFVAVTIILTLVGLAASFSPALRATNVDPLSVLRDE
jgi:predicted permease